MVILRACALESVVICEALRVVAWGVWVQARAGRHTASGADVHFPSALALQRRRCILRSNAVTDTGTCPARWHCAAPTFSPMLRALMHASRAIVENALGEEGGTGATRKNGLRY